MDYFYDYAYALMNEGYMLYEEDNGLFGGYMFLKEVVINDEENILIVELILTVKPLEKEFF